MEIRSYGQKILKKKELMVFAKRIVNLGFSFKKKKEEQKMTMTSSLVDLMSIL